MPPEVILAMLLHDADTYEEIEDYDDEDDDFEDEEY